MSRGYLVYLVQMSFLMMLEADTGCASDLQLLTRLIEKLIVMDASTRLLLLLRQDDSGADKEAMATLPRRLSNRTGGL